MWLRNMLSWLSDKGLADTRYVSDNDVVWFSLVHAEESEEESLGDGDPEDESEFTHQAFFHV